MGKIKKLLLNEFSFFVAVPALIWQILFLWLPLLFVVCFAFIKYTDLGKFYLTFDYFISVLDTTHFRVIFRSLSIALSNTLLCLTAAYPVSYFLAFKAKRWKNLMIFFLTLPLWVNFLLQVYAWFFVLAQNGIINRLLLKLHIISQPLSLMNNVFAVLLVMFHVYLPFMIMPIYNVLEKFDIQLIEASMDLGASRWTTFKKITVPLSSSGMLIGCFLVFVMSFGEFAIPMLIGGNRSLFFGTLVSEYFLQSCSMSRGAAFTILSSITMTFILLGMYFVFTRRRKG